jgi:hypothetical protein
MGWWPLSSRLVMTTAPRWVLRKQRVQDRFDCPVLERAFRRRRSGAVGRAMEQCWTNWLTAISSEIRCSRRHFRNRAGPGLHQEPIRPVFAKTAASIPMRRPGWCWRWRHRTAPKTPGVLRDAQSGQSFEGSRKCRSLPGRALRGCCRYLRRRRPDWARRLDLVHRVRRPGSTVPRSKAFSASAGRETS